ncbi:MAG TPA: HlyD family efflux transporter periplasmic adaptor subunit, partial [Candidatus Limiplasma sp.]|nr:HlyD family efflux transporter periplasmic adaptor subunit [Candidatus Limiplasma sp.]
MQGNGNPDPYSQDQWIQNMTPEQYAQWRAQNSLPPVQPTQYPPQPSMTPEQWAAMQAAQLQMSPQELMEWQAMQQAKEELARKKAKKHRRKVKRMNRSPLVRILQAMLIVGLVGGAAWLVINSMQEPKPTTAIVETASLGTTHVGDALIVRNEIVYNDEGVQNIEYIAREGSLVRMGDVVCYVFSTGYSSREMTALQDYRDQIKEYQQTLLASETAYDQKMT